MLPILERIKLLTDTYLSPLIGEYKMANVWLTYSWEDNKNQDVDFVAQELEGVGVTVLLDRWNIKTGIRLWDQIAEHITNPGLTDAWILYATVNSLQSKPCKEEFDYALGRALKTRGKEFPVIALFPSSVDESLIPPAISIRLYVSLADQNWRERIKAAAEGREPVIQRAKILPYALTVHEPKTEKQKYKIEIRPRAGMWAPFIIAVPMSEKDAIKPSIYHGPKDNLAITSIMSIPLPGEFTSPDGDWWMMRANNEATPTQSYYLQCDALPSEVLFGVFRKGEMSLYRHRFHSL